jgi:hypothetical protein
MRLLIGARRGNPMLRKAMLLSLAVFAVSAQGATANWYDEGEGLKEGENPTLQSTGTLAFTSSGGGVHCTDGYMTMQMTGSWNDGRLNAVGVENPGLCEVSGGLVFLTGGTTTLTSVTYTGNIVIPEITNSLSHINIRLIKLHYAFKNGFKVELSLEGLTLATTPDWATEMSSFALSGEMFSSLAAGKVKMSGSLAVLAPDAGTYGLVS